MQAHLEANVQGTQVSFDDATIAGLTDWVRVGKAYKLTSGTGSGGGRRGKDKGGVVTSSEVNGNGNRQGEDKKELEVTILGAMALRGVS